MAQFNSIQPLALRIREDAQPLPRDCITLSFPDHWAQEFRTLQAEVSNRAPDKVTIPIASLNRTLRALVPQILSIRRGAARSWARQNKQPWLYVRSAIDPAVLINIVHAWARVTFRRLPAERISQVLKKIQTRDIAWQVDTLNLVDWSTNPAGTATANHDGQFILLPDHIAADLSSITEGFQYGDHQLRFRRSSLATGQQGAELTSWPPLSYGNARYSVVLTFTMQTVPFQAHPLLYCDMSLRRWSGPGKIRLRKRATCYLSSNLPFIPELDGLSNQLQVASIANRRDEDGQWHTIWSDDLMEILSKLRSKVALIDAETLRTTPNAGQGDWDNATAVVYSTRMGSHRVGAGVAIRERSELFDQISQHLIELFESIAPFPRIAVSKNKIVLRENPFSRKPKTDSKKTLTDEQRAQMDANNQDLRAQRRTFIQETIGEHLNIRICASTSEVRQALADALQKILGITINANIPTAEPGISVQLDSLGSLISDLELKEKRWISQAVSDATHLRITEITRQRAHAQQPTLILAEILPKEQYAAHCDPKSPIRIGLARTGHVVQFITADTAKAAVLTAEADEADEQEAGGSLAHRAEAAVLDGLRQLGIPGKLPTPAQNQRPLTIIGVWLIHKNATRPGSQGYKLPVLVRVSSADNKILAIAPGFEDWLPYRAALTELAKRNVLNESSGQADYVAFIQNQLQQIVSLQQDTLLICHAQNMRQTWKWVGNSQLVRDGITFKKDELVRPISEWPGLRVVRVRDSQSHETPEWFAEQDGRQSAAIGLFQMGERVYASTHGKPKQWKKYSHALSKATTWTSPKKPEIIRDPEPDTATWNPGLYELTVPILQPEDAGDATCWAQLVHDLRKASLHFDDATALPMPLHLAKLMEEYILNIDLPDDDEE